VGPDGPSKSIRGLTHLESINNEYASLLPLSNKQRDFLQEKGQNSYESLEEIIQEKKKILTEYEKHNQIYYFNDKLDALAANNALIYINNCEKVERDHVKEIAANTNELLRKYIEEYGHVLDKKIERNFSDITNTDTDDPNQYSEDLEMSVQELSSLEKYPFVFESLDGAEKIKHWHRQVFKYHCFLEHEMEVFKISGRNQQFRKLLVIAQALSCLDPVMLADNGFRALYRRYQIEIAGGSKEAYTRAIDYISKRDYANADLALSDILENSLNSKFLTQIKYDLQYSLNKMIKNTKTCAHCLMGKSNGRKIIEIE
jgi:hypothetical protein